MPRAFQAGPKAGLSGQIAKLVPAADADYPEGPVFKMSEVRYPISWGVQGQDLSSQGFCCSALLCAAEAGASERELARAPRSAQDK